MNRRIALLASTLLAFAFPAAVSAQSYQSVTVSASTFAAQVGVRANEQLRITASGSLRYDLAPPSCMVVGPRGCPQDDRAGTKPSAIAPAGSLVAAFFDRTGAPVSNAFFIGEAATVIAPAGAARIAFALNVDPARRPSGAFSVTCSDVSAERAATAARGLPTEPRSLNDPAPNQRYFVQHLLRRLAFSAPPETVSAVAQNGWQAWLGQQLNPASIDDSAALGALQAKPTTTDAKGRVVDNDVYERRLIQRQFATLRQTQEKLVLHWFDHFAVGNEKVKDPALMGHYEETLRADALGNFKQLLIDVAKEPAMLYWLDNNNNPGNDLVNRPPNENFSRELMQLFIMGTNKLNIDGSPQLDGSGTPLQNYQQTDVTAVAAALTGFLVRIDYTGGLDPNTRFSVVFLPNQHAPGPKTIIGQTIADPGTAQALDVTIDALVRNPSTAPFQAKELLQRFATENPSPRYIANLAQVWANTVDAPDQIAQVVRAMVLDPEFATSYHSMSKEPAELSIDALRQLPGVLKAGTAGGRTVGGGDDLVGGFGFNGSALQQLYDPASVFSFYRPGQKDSIISQQTFLARIDAFADMLTSDPTSPATNTGIDAVQLLARVGSTDPQRVADYLLDALVDKGSASLRASVLAYLGSAAVDDFHARGAAWIIMTSPEYEVN